MTSPTSNPMVPRGARGVTLLELLTVLAIAAVIFGVGVAGYRSFAGSMEERSLASRVMTLARQARNSTTFERAPAALTLTRRLAADLTEPAESVSGRFLGESGGVIYYIPDGYDRPASFERRRASRLNFESTFRAVGYSTVAVWHLEEGAIDFGFAGRTLAFEDVQQVQGWLGKGVRLGYDRSGNPHGRSRIRAQQGPDDAFDPFTLSGGGRVELRLRADARTVAGGATVFNRPGAYTLTVLPGGELEGGTPGATVRSEPYVLTPGVWTKVALAFSPDAVAIVVDDVPRASAAGAASSRQVPSGELVFGAGFFGDMDEIRVQRRIEGEEVRVPSGFEVAAPDRLVFDARGRLDPAAHTGPARFVFTRAGRSASFVVETSGRMASQ